MFHAKYGNSDFLVWTPDDPDHSYDRKKYVGFSKDGVTVATPVNHHFEVGIDREEWLEFMVKSVKRIVDFYSSPSDWPPELDAFVIEDFKMRAAEYGDADDFKVIERVRPPKFSPENMKRHAEYLKKLKEEDPNLIF